LNIEAPSSAETSENFYQTTLCNLPTDSIKLLAKSSKAVVEKTQARLTGIIYNTKFCIYATDNLIKYVYHYPLRTKLYLSNLKNQFVPGSKHSASVIKSVS
jgi:hypothetical protein